MTTSAQVKAVAAIPSLNTQSAIGEVVSRTKKLRYSVLTNYVKYQGNSHDEYFIAKSTLYRQILQNIKEPRRL